MATSTTPASTTSEHTGVHPSRALMVIPQPRRRSVWRKLATAGVRAVALPLLLLMDGIRLAVVGTGALARGTAFGTLGALRLSGRGVAGLSGLAAAGTRGALRGAWSVVRAVAWLTATIAVVAGALVVGAVTAVANLVRLAGVGMLATCAIGAYASFHVARGAGVLAARIGAAAAAAVTCVGRALAATVRGAFAALRAVARVLFPARAGHAVTVAACAFAVLSGVDRVYPFAPHALLAPASAVVALAMVGFVAVALFGFASCTFALGLLALLCAGGVRIAADLAAQGLFAGAAAAFAYALLAGHAVFRFGHAFARPAANRAPSILRAHRDAGYGLIGLLLAQLAVCGVWLFHLAAAQRTAGLVIDLASAELVALAFGGWLAASVTSGRHLRAAQTLLLAAVASALVLGVAASFEAFGQGRAATPVSLALLGLLGVAVTSLCLVVRARIADGSYAPASAPRARAA